MPTEPQHSEIMSGEPSSSEPAHPAGADVSADTAVILAALGRIDAVVRGDRAVLDGLRRSLGEMAQAIARAKAVADSENAAAMLDEFEHRIDAMIELAEGRVQAEPPRSQPAEPAPAPAAESDQVPTVSGVVLRLGPGDGPADPAIADAAPLETAGDSGPSGTSVAMLTAMVEALSASIRPPAQQPEAQEPPPAIETATVESASLPGDAALHETALLASFEQMETRPFPPPDEGTAVIFTTRPEVQRPSEPDFVPAALPAPTVTAEPEQAAAPQPATDPAPLAQMVEVAQADPAPVTPTAPVSEAAPSTEPDFDPTDFLFGPEPEPEPAAFLLEPAPPRVQKAVVLPQPEFVSTPSGPPPAEPPPPEAPQAAPAAAADQPVEPDPQPAPHDPLHALKALSENEKIAIFS